MSFPGVLGRTDQYLAAGLRFDGDSPIRVQGGVGCCQEGTLCYGMEMLGILTKQPVVALSMLFSFYPGLRDPIPDAVRTGICAESLWPFWLLWGPNTQATGVSDYNQQQMVLGTTPYPAAYADAPNQKLLDYESIQFSWWATATTAQRKAKVVNALQAGYVLSCFCPPNHQVVVWDYVDTDVGQGVGFDTRSHYVIPGQWDLSFIQPTCILKKVAFTGARKPVFVPPSWSYPPKVTPMLNLAASLSGGNAPTGPITVTASYAGDANNAAVNISQQFNPDGTPYVGPAPTPTPAPSPSGTVTLVVGGNPAGGKYSCEAKVSVPCDHVMFFVDGKFYRQENIAPWSLFGDSGGVLGQAKFGTGTHTIRADAYKGTVMGGSATTTVTEP